MEKYLISLFLMFSGTSIAQDDIQTLTAPIICTSAAKIGEMIIEYDEKPALAGFLIRETPFGYIDNQFILYINSNTRSWTLIEKINDMYCMAASGHSISPAK
jgi:hypothetical protein